VEFQSLRDILSGHGISASQYRKIALDLAEAIAEHHERGIHHGFLSPENVVITPEGDAQILGFGVDALPESPEFFDPQPDLQAFGRILYEMATGHAPGPNPDPELLPAAELRPVITRAIAGSYASARDIASDLANDLRVAHTPILPPEPESRRSYLWVVAVLLVVALGIVLWKRGHAPHRPDRAAVTVVFFANLSGDQSLNWLSRGIPEMLTIDLQQAAGVEVISLDRQVETLLRRQQQLATLADPAAALDVARESGADYAVTGAVVRNGPSRLRLDVRMQNTAGGRTRKEFSLDAAGPGDIVKLMDQATQRIEAELLGQPRQSLATLASITTPNAEAMNHLITGLEFARIFAAAQAVKELEDALRLDPGLALANFELAELYGRAGDTSRSYELLLKAGHNLGRLPRYEGMRWQVDMATLEADEMKLYHALTSLVVAFPRDTAARNELALRYAIGNKANSAVTLVHEGLVYDPDDATLLNQMVYATAMAGDAAEMRKASDHYIEAYPTDMNALDTRGECFYILGDYAEALKAFRDLSKLKPDFGDYSTFPKIAMLLAEQGSYDDALEELQEYERRASPEGQRLATMYRARVAEAMGKYKVASVGYLSTAQMFGSLGQTEAAGEALLSLANVAVLSGENLSGTLAVVREQKLLGDELPAIAWLQAVMQDNDGARRSLLQYGAARPWLSPARISLLKAMAFGYGALARKDTAAARAVLAGAPDECYPWLEYARGVAGEGEPAFRRGLMSGRALFLPSPLKSPSPLRQKLIREKLGIKDQPKKSKPESESIHV